MWSEIFDIPDFLKHEIFFIHNILFRNVKQGMSGNNKLHCGPKKTVHQIGLSITFGVLKIYLQDFVCLYFHQFQAVCEIFMEIDGVFTN